MSKRKCVNVFCEKTKDCLAYQRPIDCEHQEVGTYSFAGTSGRCFEHIRPASSQGEKKEKP